MTENEFKITDKHMISLVCVFLFPFAPFIDVAIKKFEMSFTDQEMAFIYWYKKYWVLNLIIWIITTLIWFISYNRWLSFLNYIVLIGVISIVCMMVIWFFMIFLEKQIFSLWKWWLIYKPITTGQVNIIYYYLPIYNFYLRHQNNEDIKSYRWLKESIVFWSISVLTCLLSWSNLIIILLTILLSIIRIVTVLSGMDFIKDEWKERIDKIFDKNPEEIIWYFIWIIRHWFWKDRTSSTILMKIEQAKIEYAWLHDINSTQIIIEYLIFILIIWISFYSSNMISIFNINIYSLFILFPWIIFLWRYIVLIPTNKLPYLPIIHELVVLIKKILKF